MSIYGLGATEGDLKIHLKRSNEIILNMHHHTLQTTEHQSQELRKFSELFDLMKPAYPKPTNNT